MGVDLMKFDEIQEEIQRYSKAAGAGNFDRTAFEYSPEILPDVSAKDYSADVWAKFIAPESGMYKYEFYCKSNVISVAYMKKLNFECPPTLCARQSTSGSGNVYEINSYCDLHTYADISVGGKVRNMYYTNNSSKDIPTVWGGYILPMIPAKIESYTKLTYFFPARKGEAVVLCLVSHISDANTPTKHSVKNQKITY